MELQNQPNQKQAQADKSFAKQAAKQPMRSPELQRFVFARHPELPGWSVLDVDFRWHQTVPHASAGWIILACPTGLETFELPGWSGSLAPDSLVMLPPETIHADRAGWQQLASVRVAYLPAELPAALQLALTPQLRAGQPELRVAPDAVQTFDAWCRDFCQGARAAVLLDTLQRWLRQLPPAAQSLAPVTGLHEPPRLDDVATDLGLSRAAALRSFRRRWGCTPDQYRRQLQLRRAAQLISTGQALSDTALEAGFWDQSHLTRHFISVYGFAPGEFRRRNCVQDVSPPALPD